VPETWPGLPFEIDGKINPTLVSCRGGVPLGIELFRPQGVVLIQPLPGMDPPRGGRGDHHQRTTSQRR